MTEYRNAVKHRPVLLLLSEKGYMIMRHCPADRTVPQKKLYSSQKIRNN